MVDDKQRRPFDAISRQCVGGGDVQGCPQHHDQIRLQKRQFRPSQRLRRQRLAEERQVGLHDSMAIRTMWYLPLGEVVGEDGGFELLFAAHARHGPDGAVDFMDDARTGLLMEAVDVLRRDFHMLSLSFKLR